MVLTHPRKVSSKLENDYQSQNAYYESIQRNCNTPHRSRLEDSLYLTNESSIFLDSVREKRTYDVFYILKLKTDRGRETEEKKSQ